MTVMTKHMYSCRSAAASTASKAKALRREQSCHLDVSDRMQMAAASDADTMRRSSGMSGLPCVKELIIS